MSFTKKEVNQVKSLLGQMKLAKNQPKKTKGNKKPNNPASTIGSGVYRVTRRVLIKSITNSTASDGRTVVNYGAINLVGKNIATVSTFLGIFQEFRFVGNIVFEYIPTCSSQTNGGLIMGYSLDSTRADDRGKVASLSPVVESPVWQRGSLTISPKSYQRAAGALNKKDDALFSILYNNSSQDLNVTFGELWMRFTAEFVSPIA